MPFPFEDQPGCVAVCPHDGVAVLKCDRDPVVVIRHGREAVFTNPLLRIREFPGLQPPSRKSSTKRHVSKTFEVEDRTVDDVHVQIVRHTIQSICGTVV